MAFQSQEILLRNWGVDGWLWVRPEGACGRAHEGTHPKLARRTKVGYVPFCSRATHIAALLLCEVGEFSDAEARALSPGSSLAQSMGGQTLRGLFFLMGCWVTFASLGLGSSAT